MKRVRTHNMAKALLEMTAWDLYAKTTGRRCRRCWAARAIASPRACRSASRTRSISWWRRSAKERAAGYQRIKIKIKPGWDIDAVERVRSHVRRHPADGRRQRRLSARRQRAPGPPRSLRPDDDRAAARLRRRDGPRRAAAGAGDADLPGRVDPHGPHRPRRDRGEGLPDHQHQARPRRRPPAVDRAARPVRRQRHPGVARRHARKRHRPRPQHPPRQPAELPPARRHRRQQALLRAGSDRAGASTSPTTAPSRCRPGPGIGVTVRRDRVEKATERHLVIDAREVAR